MPEQSLKDKTVKGTFWSAADAFLGQGITFLVGLVLARLLSPEEYGLIGIITIFISIFNSIVDSGFSNALIRKNDANETDYNTVFWCNLCISVILCITLFFCSWPIADFFDRPPLVPLTQAMSVIVIINAFAIIQRTILVKKIDFKTQTKASLFSSITSGIVGICMAFSGCGVWSLVGQQLTRQTLNTLLLWIFNKWRPRRVFSWASFKELFGFGWKLLVSGLINTVWNQVYQVVIGKCYTPAALGQYTRAEQFAGIFSQNLTYVVSRVTYPVLSSIQDDKLRLKEAYRRIIRCSMLVSFSLLLGLAAVANNFVYVLIGEKWMECVPMLQIICFSMMLYPLHSINLNMLQVAGRSDLFLKLEIIKKSIAVVPILLGVFIGIYWMLISSVVVGVISYFLNAHYSGRFLDYNVGAQIKDIYPSFIICLIMASLVYMLGQLSINPYVALPLQIIIGAGIVIGIGEMVKLNEYVELRKIAIDFIKRNK